MKTIQKKIKIALFGYGKMGQEIAQIAKDYNAEIVSVSFGHRNEAIDTKNVKNADVIIDFTSPEAVLGNITTAVSLDKPIVVGTTGWGTQLDEVKRIVAKGKGTLLFASNFSVGANILFAVTEYASTLLTQFGKYDVTIHETHHAGKKDSPSGTALTFAEKILKNYPAKKRMQLERLTRPIQPDELQISSNRVGSNPGEHHILFDSRADTIELAHIAHNRRGFAEGALLAARFVMGRKGFFTFDDVFKIT